jgi:hypothetical protein
MALGRFRTLTSLRGGGDRLLLSQFEGEEKRPVRLWQKGVTRSLGDAAQ